MSPAMSSDAPEAIAREGAISDPEIIPRTANAHRVLTSADHNAMNLLCLIEEMRARKRIRSAVHEVMTNVILIGHRDSLN